MHNYIVRKNPVIKLATSPLHSNNHFKLIVRMKVEIFIDHL